MLLCITCMAAWGIRCVTSCAAKGKVRPRAGRIQPRAPASFAPKTSVLPAVNTDFKLKMQKQTFKQRNKAWLVEFRSCYSSS